MAVKVYVHNDSGVEIRAYAMKNGELLETETVNVAPAIPIKKARRGFHTMSSDARRAIAAKGGKASHEQGTGHTWTSAEARAAGRKGGQATRAKKAGAK